MTVLARWPYAFALAPLGLVVVGGATGLAVGGLAAALNLTVMPRLRALAFVAASLGVSAAGFLLCGLIALAW